MTFCEKCGYLFNITKEVKRKQIGGEINKSLLNIFNKFDNNEKLTKKDIKKIIGKDVIEDDRFDELNKKNKKRLMTEIKEIDENFFVEKENLEQEMKTNVAYFICTFCNNYKKIEPGTSIYSKSYDTSATSENDDYKYTINDPTLFRTRNYNCPNKKCKSRTDDSVREAVMTRNANYQIMYVCTSCSTHWINTF